MKEVLNRKLLTAVRHNGSLGFTYLNNPKSGCGHIKAAMWAQVDKNSGTRTLDLYKPHDRAASPFVNSLLRTDSYDFPRFAATPFFTVVRNPFTRALSGYLSKIEKGRPGCRGRAVWLRFCERYGVDPASTGKVFTFKHFLRALASDSIDALDPHFRPQYINILYPFTPFKFIGKLEQMDAAHQFMAAHGVEPGDYMGKPTGSSDLVEDYYDEECEALVRKIYRDDFLAFGYAETLRDVRAVTPVPPRGEVPNRLLKFIETQSRRTKKSKRRRRSVAATIWRFALKWAATAHFIPARRETMGPRHRS